MDTITIREQPNGLLSVQIGRTVAGMNLDTEEALAVVEAELRMDEVEGR